MEASSRDIPGVGAARTPKNSVGASRVLPLIIPVRATQSSSEVAQVFGEQEIKLEAYLHCPPSQDDDQLAHRPEYAIIVTHPHPKLGGDLQNNVTYGLARLLSRKLGCPVLRYNSRGVGRSTGSSTWFGTQEVDDLITCIAAMKDGHGPVGAKRIYIVGYSFGSSVLGSALREIFTIKNQREVSLQSPAFNLVSGDLATVPSSSTTGGAPTVVTEVAYQYAVLAKACAGAIFLSYPCGFFSRFLLGHHISSLRAVAAAAPIPMHFIQGDCDELTSALTVESIVAELGHHARSITVRNVGHSWWGSENHLSDIVCESIKNFEQLAKQREETEQKLAALPSVTGLPPNTQALVGFKPRVKRYNLRQCLWDQHGWTLLSLFFMVLYYLLIVVPRAQRGKQFDGPDPWYLKSIKLN